MGERMKKGTEFNGDRESIVKCKVSVAQEMENEKEKKQNKRVMMGFDEHGAWRDKQ